MAALTPLDRVRRICLALPEVTEKISHGEPNWFAGRSFASFANNHHGDGRIAVWCAAPPGMQDERVAADPVHFFVPAYVGYRGWVGLRVDLDGPWDLVEDTLELAYRTIAPARLIAQLDASSS